MDIFKFNNPNAPTKMEQGEIINNLKSKMWVERYRDAGEFTLIAPANSGIKEKLPIGTFISHIKTTEIMIVENHEISDTAGNESDVIITGRGFETFFENRIVGSNKTYPVSQVLSDYLLPANYTWNQAVTLINNHILASSLIDKSYAFPYVSVSSIVSGTSISIERTFPSESLYSHILKLLAIDDLGIKIIRPGLWSIVPLDTTVVIHVGIDKSAKVVFSYDTGEIISADYLWSNKKLKNAAMVSGKWVQTVVNPIDIEYKKRMMYVDAKDIDEKDAAAPSGARLTEVVAAMQQRGKEALASKNNLVLTKANVIKEVSRATYRVDFDVGDLIMVGGDYNQTAPMRVSEYVEIEDSTGESGYPTLTIS